MENLPIAGQLKKDRDTALSRFAKRAVVDRREREDSTEMTDGELARLALLGNEQGFELLVHRYSQQLFHFIYHILRDYEKSADVLQTVFLKLYLSLPQLKQNQSFKAWLFRVANNCCIDECRFQKRRSTFYFSELSYISDDNKQCLLEELIETNLLPEEIAIEQDTWQHLLQAIETLPARYRSVVFLRSIAQYSFAEIGRLLHMPQATAKTYFHRAKPRLRAVLREML